MKIARDGKHRGTGEGLSLGTAAVGSTPHGSKTALESIPNPVGQDEMKTRF